MTLTEAVTREELYALVWAEPMVRVAEKFGVSSSYLARVCTQLYVPRASRGYWAKLEVGNAPAKPALHPPPPGVPASWSPGTALDVPISHPVQAPDNVDGSSGQRLHSALRGVREHFAKGSTARECGYLKPAKWTLPDLTVTANTLDRAIELADTLYRALENAGATVVLDAGNRPDFGELEDGSHLRYNNLWVPRRSTVAVFGDVAIGFAIGELSEVVPARYVNGKFVREDSEQADKARKSRYGSHTWTSEQPFATGRLFVIAYAASRYASSQQRWNEKSLGDLEKKIPSICRFVKHSLREVREMICVGEEQARVEHERWEAHRRAWRLRDEAERRENARQASSGQLLQICDEWNKAAQVRAFLSEAQAGIKDVSEQERAEYEQRLLAARAILGDIDLARTLMAWNPPLAKDAEPTLSEDARE